MWYQACYANLGGERQLQALWEIRDEEKASSAGAGSHYPLEEGGQEVRGLYWAIWGNRERAGTRNERHVEWAANEAQQHSLKTNCPTFCCRFFKYSLEGFFDTEDDTFFRQIVFYETIAIRGIFWRLFICCELSLIGAETGPSRPRPLMAIGITVSLPKMRLFGLEFGSCQCAFDWHNYQLLAQSVWRQTIKGPAIAKDEARSRRKQPLAFLQ